MVVEKVEVLVEEPSMEAALRVLLPRFLGDVAFDVYPHASKQQLLARLPARLRSYARWIPPTWRIVVIVDRDDDDCHELKLRIEKMIKTAGLASRTSGKRPWVVVTRIAIEELEAWYFGDWAAVQAAYPRVPATIPQRARYRAPDAIGGGTWETFERLLQAAGYFEGGLRKIEAARAVSEHMAPERNRSPSFVALRSALEELSS